MIDASLSAPQAEPAAIPTSNDTLAEESTFPVTTPQWPMTVRYGIGIALIAICVVGMFLLLPLLQVILLSFLIAFIMFLPSRALSRRTHLPYGISVVLSFVIAAAIVFLLAVLLLPEIMGMFRSIGDAAHQASANVMTQLENAPASIEAAGMTINTADLATALQHLNLPIEASHVVNTLAHMFFGFFSNAAALAAAIGTASIVALFFLIGLPISGGTMTNWVPKSYQREIALLFGKLDVLWIKFFRALIIIGVITGVASFVLFELFGIKGSLLLAVVTATICMIPYLGRILSLLLIFIVALINGSTRFTSMDNLTFTVLTIIAYLIVAQAINTIVSPQLKGSALNVPVVAIVIGVMVGIMLAGVLGALLVAPVMGSVRVFMQYSIAKILLRDPYPGEEVLTLQQEGFFSHMLYVKKKPSAEAEA